MTRETRQEREKRLAEALRRNLSRRKQARRGDTGQQSTKQNDDDPDTSNGE